jgi:spermidine synthase
MSETGETATNAPWQPSVGTELVERATTESGDVALVRVRTPEGPHYELRINGIYVMATYCRESEADLARMALEAIGQRQGARVLIGGLGAGMTLRQVLNAPWVEHVTVVEIEPLVESWCREYFGAYNGNALDDDRTEVVLADIGAYASDTNERYDAILLDMDNGPDQMILPANAPLYTDVWLRNWSELLTDGGVLAIWSARPDDSFTERARRAFAHATMHCVATAQSVHSSWPDAVYILQTAD